MGDRRSSLATCIRTAWGGYQLSSMKSLQSLQTGRLIEKCGGLKRRLAYREFAEVLSLRHASFLIIRRRSSFRASDSSFWRFSTDGRSDMVKSSFDVVSGLDVLERAGSPIGQQAILTLSVAHIWRLGAGGHAFKGSPLTRGSADVPHRFPPVRVGKTTRLSHARPFLGKVLPQTRGIEGHPRQQKLPAAVQGAEAIILAVPHEPYLNLDPAGIACRAVLPLITPHTPDKAVRLPRW